MNSKRLDAILAQISQLSIAVIGDFALDLYFNINPNSSEFSVETGQEVHLCHHPTAYLGGAGNVAKNLAHLGVQVDAYGIKGNDLFGREMTFQANKCNISTEHLQTIEGIDTPTYTKPMQADVELNRLDFGTQNDHFQTHAKSLIDSLEKRLTTYQWVIVNEQFSLPLLNLKNLIYLQSFLGENSIADLRSLGNEAKNTLLKVNEAEVTNIIGPLTDTQTQIQHWANERMTPVLVTLGEKGMIYASPTEFHWQKAIPVHGPFDTVGAGDMVVAAFSAAKAAGASQEEACEFASLAVHISIQKIGETGSASPDEIKQLHHAIGN
jgi:rfaE bifunctional protein kinase chain/domain